MRWFSSSWFPCVLLVRPGNCGRCSARHVLLACQRSCCVQSWLAACLGICMMAAVWVMRACLICPRCSTCSARRQHATAWRLLALRTWRWPALTRLLCAAVAPSAPGPRGRPRPRKPPRCHPRGHRHPRQSRRRAGVRVGQRVRPQRGGRGRVRGDPVPGVQRRDARVRGGRRLPAAGALERGRLALVRPPIALSQRHSSAAPSTPAATAFASLCHATVPQRTSTTVRSLHAVSSAAQWTRRCDLLLDQVVDQPV